MAAKRLAQLAERWALMASFSEPNGIAFELLQQRVARSSHSHLRLPGLAWCWGRVIAMRPSVLWLLFWMLFVFWFVAFYFHLGGGLVTYSLFLIAIAFFVRAASATKRA